VRAACRYFFGPTRADDYLGFRCRVQWAGGGEGWARLWSPARAWGPWGTNGPQGPRQGGTPSPTPGHAAHPRPRWRFSRSAQSLDQALLRPAENERCFRVELAPAPLPPSWGVSAFSRIRVPGTKATRLYTPTRPVIPAS